MSRYDVALFAIANQRKKRKEKIISRFLSIFLRCLTKLMPHTGFCVRSISKIGDFSSKLSIYIEISRKKSKLNFSV